MNIKFSEKWKYFIEGDLVARHYWSKVTTSSTIQLCFTIAFFASKHFKVLMPK